MKLRFYCIILAALTLIISHPANAAPVKIACIGDSITEGAGVDNPTVNAYPIVLGRLLGTNYTTRNFGVSGRTLLRKGDYPYWNETAFRNATNFAPDIVTIKLGTNDSKPQNWKYKDQFAKDLRDMADVFSNLPFAPQDLSLPSSAGLFDHIRYQSGYYQKRNHSHH